MRDIAFSYLFLLNCLMLLSSLSYEVLDLGESFPTGASWNAQDRGLAIMFNEVLSEMGLHKSCRSSWGGGLQQGLFMRFP